MRGNDITGRADSDTIIKGETIKSEKLFRAAQLEAAKSIKAAEAARASAVYLAEAREVAAKAEGEAATNLEQKRHFEQQLRLGSLDAQFAARGRKVLSGDAGAQIMKSLVMVRDELAVSSAASS